MKPCRAIITPLVLAIASMTLAGCARNTNEETEHEEAAFRSAPLLGPEPRQQRTRHPIVLVSGFASSPRLNGFVGVAEAYQAYGQEAHVADLPPYDSAATRGAALAAQITGILEKTGAAKVNLIAHSMGGLDSRVAINDHALGDRVASLITISSPHGGSALGDLGVQVFRQPNRANSTALNAFATLLGGTFSDVANDSHLFDAFVSLSIETAPTFNAAHPDDPRVHYESWAGISAAFGIMLPGLDAACDGKHYGDRGIAGSFHVFIGPMAAVNGPEAQDGLVTVERAKHGLFRGCIPVDHLDEVGDPKAPQTSPATGFDRIRFYTSVADDLAARGF